MSYCPDIYDQWRRHDALQANRLALLPKCCICKEPIQQEEAICHDGKWYCAECELEAWAEIRKELLERVDAE